MINILVAEDDKNIRKLYEDVLRSEGFGVVAVADGQTALEIFYDYKFDLAIIDIMMPRIDGLTLVHHLRQNKVEIPFIIVSAKSDAETIKSGFNYGIDDYMTKPIDMNELVLRIKAIFRRMRISFDKKIVIGDLTFNYESFTLTRKGVEIDMPKKEFLLIYKLLSYPKKIFTKAELLDDIWGIDSYTSDSSVVVHINRLRKRFKGYPEFKIVTARGIGYKVIIYEKQKTY